jgi:UDPglucose 6-dehydrogenase
MPSQPRHICVIGTGYVGLVTGTIFAELGQRVTCVDVDELKVEMLRSGRIPIHEPRLPELVARNVEAGRLTFSASYSEGLRTAEFVFLAVPTPTAEGSDAADLRYIQQATLSIASRAERDLIVVVKSTVPVGTGRLVARLLAEHGRPGRHFAVVSNPEFLREGSAIADCLQPDRVVVGSDSREAADAVAALYASLACPLVVTDLATAEMTKYASNAMLAARISFMNEIAGLCETVGADVTQVARGMGLDRRIGPAFLSAGLGYGGSCFPKDVRALMHMLAAAGGEPYILKAVNHVNRLQRRRTVDKLRRLCGPLAGRTIGLLGLAFKPDTDDLREAPALEIAQVLLSEGAHVKAFDPVAMSGAEALLPQITCCDDPYQLAAGADALIAVTEWEEIRRLDMASIRSRMRTPAVILDGRNMFDPEQLIQLGFVYAGTGRYANPARSRCSAESLSVPSANPRRSLSGRA